MENHAMPMSYSNSPISEPAAPQDGGGNKENMKSLVLLTGTNETLKYAESLQQFGDVKILRYDTPGGSDGSIYHSSKEVSPDFIVYVGSRWGPQPSIATLANINATIAPMIHLCSDAADSPWWDLLREYHAGSAFSLQVNIDGAHKWPLASSQMTALTPVDPALFERSCTPHYDRGVQLGYAGNGGGGPQSVRTIMLSELLKHRVLDIRIRSNLPYTYEAYCDYLCNCRFSLNIAYSGTETAMQVKGRVVESGLAGACLLETKGSPTRRWFTPGIDYMEYESADEAIELLNTHPALVQTIADRLKLRVETEHSPKQFWERIFERVGVKP